MISTHEIRNKEIINIADGKSLGFVTDIEINLEKGRVEALIVPAQRGLIGFFTKDSEYIIKWKNIKKIGEDVILADVQALYGDEYYERKDFKEMDETEEEI